ncbi:hypothetical protein [Ruegeria meonggei]|uniref:Uncharacterized protein n=1 Tax=Ruegeria meonggei TaxID=1446476 RepID=A0A1X6Z161_9RHOB|nr:hypothetical protein [Ruegeria meonggei]SLN37688.1 hypothetical protein RUM8411_01641 [Ruegeria meonggei]
MADCEQRESCFVRRFRLKRGYTVVISGVDGAKPFKRVVVNGGVTETSEYDYDNGASAPGGSVISGNAPIRRAKTLAKSTLKDMIEKEIVALEPVCAGPCECWHGEYSEIDWGGAFTYPEQEQTIEIAVKDSATKTYFYRVKAKFKKQSVKVEGRCLDLDKYIAFEMPEEQQIAKRTVVRKKKKKA